MGNPEDLQDMRAFQKGDAEGFRRLFHRYSNPLLNYLSRITGNRAVAEELVQEVFLRVSRAAGSYEPRTAFRTWLYTIATNVARNEVRKREYSVKMEPIHTRPDPAGSGSSGLAGQPETGSPEELAGARKLEEIIQQGLSELPEKQRTALLLSRHHGFSYEEIAGVMNLRLGAVKSLIHRATRNLRGHLESYDEILPRKGGAE